MFKVGDVVVLKSGGPKMTVTEAPTEDVLNVDVSYFNDSYNYIELIGIPCDALKSYNTEF